MSAVAVLSLTAACAGVTYPAGQACDAGGYIVLDGFAAARRGECTKTSTDRVRLDIRPESSGRINDSPWYAFKIEPRGAESATVTLRYHGGHHRYWPKISTDGISWMRLDEHNVRAARKGRKAKITVPLTGQQVWVAAQELITPPIYETWNGRTARTTGVPMRELGKSTSGRPIHVFDTGGEARDVLFLIGRQHPPEVSGAFAFFAFAETVFGNSRLAGDFRARFRVIAIPLLNPDGVVGGNWRHNLGGKDLNRDWGKFEQPETRLVGELLDELDASGNRLRMFIDFHSTRENVFFTQLDQTYPPGFTARWLDNAAARISNYPFRNGRGPATSPYIAKNYIFTRYGIPSVTFEVGDETDREATRSAARIFAEELMSLMLAQDYQSAARCCRAAQRKPRGKQP